MLFKRIGMAVLYALPFLFLLNVKLEKII